MQWSPEPNGGFSTAEKLVRPAAAGGPYGYEAVNVDDQLRRPSSLLRWMIEMIRVRKQSPEIGVGTWQLLPTRDAHVLALRYDVDGTTVVTVHNLDESPREVAITVDGSDDLASLLDHDPSRADHAGKHRLRLEPYDYRWYRGVGRTRGS
jgi:maltose alpha-D-glucosyltransferase/alpha-amylase